MMELKTVAVLDEGCFSVLLWNGRPFAVTLERTFEGRRVVIPTGQWLCTRTVFQKHGYETFEIHIPGHTRVLFHIGNKEDDSLACVLVGEFFAVFGAVDGIGDSARGFAEFMQRTEGLSQFYLNVSGR